MGGIEIDVVPASGSNLTCFLCGGESWLRFCVRTENCSVLNWIEIDLIFTVGTEIDLVSCMGVEGDLFFSVECDLLSFRACLLYTSDAADE